MSIIGDQIKKYRIEKEITQEQLGQMLNVTTQAVSRWERGGTPDAEMLPQIAEVLGVSIDALFGLEEQSMNLNLARRLSQMSREEAYRHAFNICWAIEIGLLGNVSAIDDFMKPHIERKMVSHDKKTDYLAKMVNDGGIALVRMSPDLNTFFLMPEPEGRISDQLCSIDELLEVFTIFADRKMLQLIYIMYSMPNIPLATSLLSKKRGFRSRKPTALWRCCARKILPPGALLLLPKVSLIPIFSAGNALLYRCCALRMRLQRKTYAPFWAITTEQSRFCNIHKNSALMNSSKRSDFLV